MTDEPKPAKPTGKKSEAIEIRLPHSDKLDFMEACKARGETASSVLRGAIGQYLEHGHFGANTPKYRSSLMMLSGMIIGGMVVGAVLTNRSETPLENPVMTAHFKRIDTSADGMITLAEFLKGTVKTVTEHSVILRLNKPFFFNTHDDIDTNDFAVGPTKPGEVKHVTFTLSSALIEAIDKSRSEDEGPKCSNALREIRNAEIAREFYTLDQDSNNLLTAEEFSRNQLLPSLGELKAKFAAIDENGDEQLSQPEINADLSLREPELLREPVTYAPRKLQVLPAICQSPIGSHTAQQSGGPQVSVEEMFTDLSKWSLAHTPPVDGMNPALFRRLDADNNRKLNFDEFVTWYF